jgi:hypothetical protein
VTWIAAKSTRRLVTRYTSLGRSLLLWLALGAALILPLVSSEVSAHPEPRATTSPKLYFGLEYPQTPDISALGKYETQIGKGASLVLWYQSWEQGNQMQPFPTGQMEAVREHGAIPVLGWDPDEYPSPLNVPQFSLAKIAGGAWDSYIRQYAAEVKAWGHPLFLRFASEMNGGWTSWSEFHSGNSAGQFVKAWRHVHDIFTSVGATNVTWVWCPNVENAYTTPLEDLYPGNAYVDWAGLDGYNYSIDFDNFPWRTFPQVFRETYDHLLKLIPRTMPILIGETGTVEDGGSKAAWITDALTTQLPANFPQIKALIWFDSSDGKINLSIDTSPQSLGAFRKAIASTTYASNNYSTLNQSPIPAPEQVVLPGTPVPTPTATISGAPAFPITTSYLSGASPGTIQVINAQNNQPVPKAALLYQDGVTTVTNSSGVTRPPSKDPSPVLKQIVVGTVVIHTQLAIDPQRGYQIEINPASGKITQVLVHINLLPLVIEFALLILLVAIVFTAFFRRRARRRRAQTPERGSRKQPSHAGFG